MGREKSFGDKKIEVAECQEGWQNLNLITLSSHLKSLAMHHKDDVQLSVVT